MIQLSNLVDLRESVAPRELGRMNQLRSADITANIAPGYSQGEALAALEQTRHAACSRHRCRSTISAKSREFMQASGDIYFTFVLALLFIYLVLAAQFESFIDPFIIMLTVPLSMTGALLALKLGGGTMNIYSQVGLVTLVGLITKNGILIVEFANQLQEQGKSKARGGHRSGGAAAAANPHDHRRHGAGRGAAWRWRLAQAPRAATKSAS